VGPVAEGLGPVAEGLGPVAEGLGPVAEGLVPVAAGGCGDMFSYCDLVDHIDCKPCLL